MGHIPARPYNGEVRYGIVADDLTGSCDVAGRLTHLGYRPVVRVRPAEAGENLSLPSEEATVVIVNTRSRDCPLREAVARARAATGSLERSGAPVIYQKIDSTLRGHWAEELKAIAALRRPQRVLICPAFPAHGRLIRGGQLRLRRAEREGFLYTTEAGSPPSLRTSLRKRCGWDAQEVQLEVVRQGAGAIRKALEERRTARRVIFDATRERDLEAIGRAFRNSAGRLLWVGSAGLIRAVIPPLPRPESAPHSRPEGPWLLVQGSRQPISQAQFQRLEVEHAAHLIDFSPTAGRKEQQSSADAGISALAAGKNVAVTVPREFDPRVPREFPRFLGGLLERILTAPRLGGIFVTGGNTAEAVCDSLRVRTLRVTEEIRPGIAWSLALDGRLPGLHLVTKAGGFGMPGEVGEIVERCTRARRSPSA